MIWQEGVATSDDGRGAVDRPVLDLRARARAAGAATAARSEPVVLPDRAPDADDDVRRSRRSRPCSTASAATATRCTPTRRSPRRPASRRRSCTGCAPTASCCASSPTPCSAATPTQVGGFAREVRRRRLPGRDLRVRGWREDGRIVGAATRGRRRARRRAGARRRRAHAGLGGRTAPRAVGHHVAPATASRRSRRRPARRSRTDRRRPPAAARPRPRHGPGRDLAPASARGRLRRDARPRRCGTGRRPAAGTAAGRPAPGHRGTCPTRRGRRRPTHALSTRAWSTHGSTRTFAGWAPRSGLAVLADGDQDRRRAASATRRDQRTQVEGAVLDRPHRHVDQRRLLPVRPGAATTGRSGWTSVMWSVGLGPDRGRADVEVGGLEAAGVRRHLEPVLGPHRRRVAHRPRRGAAPARHRRRRGSGWARRARRRPAGEASSPFSWMSRSGRQSRAIGSRSAAIGGASASPNIRGKTKAARSARSDLCGRPQHARPGAGRQRDAGGPARDGRDARVLQDRVDLLPGRPEHVVAGGAGTRGRAGASGGRDRTRSSRRTGRARDPA